MFLLDCGFGNVHEAILILEMQNNAFYHSTAGSRVDLIAINDTLKYRICTLFKVRIAIPIIFRNNQLKFKKFMI